MMTLRQLLNLLTTHGLVTTHTFYYLANALTNETEEGVRGDQAVRRKKVGNLEIEFFDSKSGVTDSNDWLTAAKEMLSGLIGAMFFTRRV